MSVKMFPDDLPIESWVMFNSTIPIVEWDYPWSMDRTLHLKAKMKAEDQDMTNFTTLALLGIIYISSQGKKSMYLKIKSWIDKTLLLLGTLYMSSQRKKSKCLKKKSWIDKTTIIKVGKKYMLTLITYMVQIMAGIFIHAVTLPLVVPVLLIFWLISRVVKVLLWLQYGNTASKCSGMDAAWGLESPLSRPIITGLLTLSGVPDIEKIRNHIKSKIVDAMEPSGNYQYRKFRQLFFRQYGYYVWQDDAEFDIKNHVTLVSLKHNGWNKKNKIQKYASKAETMTMAADRPPWHITVLDTGDGRYSLLILLHHAIGDGVSMVRVCMESLVDTPVPSMYPSPHKPHKIVQLLIQLWSVLVLPLGMLKIIVNNDKSSLHVPLSGEKIAVSSNGIPLDLVRHVKKTASATVNDVLMSCISSATTKLLARRKETCTKITTIIPVSFHQEDEKRKLNNCWSCGIVKLSTEPKTSPLARLRKTKNVFDKLKVDPTLAAVYWTISLASDIIPAPIAEILFAGKGISLAASNMPGPQQKLVIWGDTVEDIGFWVPNRAPTGVGVSIMSYMGVIKAFLNVDSSLIGSEKEAQQFLDDFEWEVYQLKDELINTKERYNLAHWSHYKAYWSRVKA